MKKVLYDIAAKAGKLISVVVRALEDKKISRTEGVGLFAEFSSFAWIIFRSRDDIGKILGDGLSINERDEFVEGFNAGFDLKDDEMEHKVEKYSSIAAQLVTVIANLFLLKVENEPQTTEVTDTEQDDA